MMTSVRTVLMVACAALVVTASTAWAQPASEVFIGYSYLRADPGRITHG